MLKSRWATQPDEAEKAAAAAAAAAPEVNVAAPEPASAPVCLPMHYPRALLHSCCRSAGI
jgi:hypothetical protein